MSFLRLFGCFSYFCWLLFPCIFLCFPKSITHLNGAGSAIPVVQCEMVADRAMVTVDTCGVGVGVFKGGTLRFPREDWGTLQNIRED